MAHQVEITVGASVRDGATAALKQVLSAMSANAGQNAIIPFASLPGTHFARLLLVEELSGSPLLLLMIDADAPTERVLRCLVDTAGAGLDVIFGLCQGYPSLGNRTGESRLHYLRSRLSSVDMFYVHTVGRTLEQVRQEARLTQAIRQYVDGLQPTSALPNPQQMRAAIQTFVEREPALAWARQPAAPPELLFRMGEAIHTIAVPALLIALAPLLPPTVLMWLIALRRHESTDPEPAIALNPTRLRELSELEDFVVQNAISTVADIKPGFFWHLTATIFYGIGSYAARHVFNNGDLAGLRTVHFARFMRIDHRQKVLFTSYYDGSLEAYMNDFIDQVGWVLNSMFGNQTGYPTTRWLFAQGASNERGFKGFIRGHQIPTLVWYSAYPDLSAANIDNNAQIRAGLFGKLTLAETKEWLRRL